MVSLDFPTWGDHLDFQVRHVSAQARASGTFGKVTQAQPSGDAENSKSCRKCGWLPLGPLWCAQCLVLPSASLSPRLIFVRVLRAGLSVTEGLPGAGLRDCSVDQQGRGAGERTCASSLRGQEAEQEASAKQASAIV